MGDGIAIVQVVKREDSASFLAFKHLHAWKPARCVDPIIIT